ncbi:MAG TPA: IMP dehydrogenase, partial [Candidatus Dojkabacteria bacterium]
MSEVTSQLDLYPNNDLEKEFIDFFTEGVGYSRAYYEAVRRLEDGSSETYALLEVESRGSGEAYPGIGLQPLNEVDIFDAQARELNPWVVTEILKQRLYYIALANHPSRIEGLREARRSRFIPPQPQENVFIENSIREGRAITWKHLTTNLANHPIDGQPRSSRRNIYARGIYIPVGEDHAVMPFFSSETPDAVASPMATATMAAMHGFAMIPKDAQFKGEEGIVRQAEYIQQTYKWLDVMSREIFDDEATRIEMLEYWKRNVVAVVEPSVDKAMRRVQYLRQQTGINSFRIYSPEKGNDKLDVIRQIKEMSSNSIVIVGQVTTMGEIQQAENEGVDMCIGGIGGGGHCTTGEKG